MNGNRNTKGRGSMRFASGIFLVALAVVLMGQSAPGQTGDSASTEKAAPVARQELVVNPRVDSRPYQTFYLVNVAAQNDANEIVIAVRNIMPPDVKIYLVPSQNAISMRGSAEDLVLAQKVIHDLDRPKKTYRLIYTLTDMDGGKRIGVQHFGMIVFAGQRTTLKQGSKVPIATGSSTEGSSGSQTQFTYLDVGLNFDATLDPFADGMRLRSKVEQSSIAEEKSGFGPQDPIVRQTVLEGMSFLTPGKPLVLGSLDIPGSTRHLDVDVVMEQIAQ
jgi:type II secretory pathway component GspD/PulD (secretin)